MLAELLWFGHGRKVQCDPSLYFPTIPILRELAAATPGRIIGQWAFPPNLAAICGLRDIRGYDAVDPHRMVELVLGATDPNSPANSYALTQFRVPVWNRTASGEWRLPPILDMLDVRYVICRGTPPAETRPALQGPDYYVLENTSAVGRVFVPHRVEVVANDDERLKKMASLDFDSREIAYVETAVNLPQRSIGEAKVIDEIPLRVTVSFNMATAGLLVLTDRWDKGWRATVNGKSVPILRTDHAIRGVVVPEGAGTIVFRYEPASFALGVKLAGFAALVIMLRCGFLLWRRRTQDSRLDSAFVG
jgi:hypothetical protein